LSFTPPAKARQLTAQSHHPPECRGGAGGLIRRGGRLRRPQLARYPRTSTAAPRPCRRQISAPGHAGHMPTLPSRQRPGARGDGRLARDVWQAPGNRWHGDHQPPWRRP